MWNDIKKSILSGILISIGCSVYLCSIKLDFSWLGAILFTGGLFTICEYNFNLYTGKVGYIAHQFKNGKYYAFVALVCVFNVITTFLIGLVCGKIFPTIYEEATKLYSAKLSASLLKDFVSSIFCGILMFLAVDTWKRGRKFALFIYIPTFIICGFDHSIANAFYNGASWGDYSFSWQNLVFILIVILGNGIGGILIAWLTKNLGENNSGEVGDKN